MVQEGHTHTHTHTYVLRFLSGSVLTISCMWQWAMVHVRLGYTSQWGVTPEINVKGSVMFVTIPNEFFPAT